MKKLLFTKSNDISLIIHPMFYYMILCLLTFVISNEILSYECRWSAVLILLMLGISDYIILRLALKENGSIYFTDKYICYGGILNKKTKLNEILGLKVIYSQDNILGKKYYLKDKNKISLYSIILLKNIDDSMCMYNLGDLNFEKKFHKSVICKTVYDPELIDYLKQLIPDIVVMSDIH